MKIVQFSRPSPPVHLRPLYLGRWANRSSSPTNYMITTDTSSNGPLARISAMVMIGITLSSLFSSHVIFSISSSRVGRATGISWLGSLCFVTNPNPRFWCLVMVQIQFSLIKKIKAGRPEHSLSPHPLSPITSYFCHTSQPPPLLKVDVMCVWPRMRKVVLPK